MFTVGGVVTGAAPGMDLVFVCQVRLDGALWGLTYGPRPEEARRRAQMVADALNRERELN